jgi:hypothetical protein
MSFQHFLRFKEVLLQNVTLRHVKDFFEYVQKG